MARCKDFKSLQSSLIAVSGCWLKILSIWHKIVVTVSSVNTWWFVTDFSDCLTCFISDSHTPLIHGLGGGLNFHSILHGLNSDVAKSKLTFFSANLNSFSARTKLAKNDSYVSSSWNESSKWLDGRVYW